ncbi:glycosyltransferase family protein [Agromyces sp. M3QZ16-3]|uniref:glycosyltransferase family protein n=1 Tax=Agromyces sp. M3QZ16-3 TaxID=3447585 RepID=UPI003F693739
MTASSSLRHRLVALIPDAVLMRLRPQWFAYSAEDVPQPIAVPEGTARLLIAPANFAGQGYEWAHAADSLPDVGSRNMSYRAPGEFAFPTDYEVPTAVFLRSKTWQAGQARAIARYSHVIIEAERPILGARYQSDLVREVEAFRADGLRVAMLCHGSDIRLPSRHRRREPDSPFVEGGYAETDVLERQAVRHRTLLDRIGATVFVSTPDLLLDVPEGVWLPVIVGERWRTLDSAPPLTAERPLVVHIPSRAGLKGSDLIEDTMRALDADGTVRYERHEGVPPERMPELYARADIVLDQFSLGIYGVATCEALAAGRVVVSHVSDQVRGHVRDETGLELPVVEARAAELADVIRTIVADRERFREIAARGPAFVREVHDGRRSAAVLAERFLFS